jgi:hypothetical protein
MTGAPAKRQKTHWRASIHRRRKPASIAASSPPQAQWKCVVTITVSSRCSVLNRFITHKARERKQFCPAALRLILSTSSARKEFGSRTQMISNRNRFN